MSIPLGGGQQILLEYVLTCSSSTLTAPTVTVPDAYDANGNGNTAEDAINADGHPLIWYCAGTNMTSVPIATAQGEPGAIFIWYRDIDPLSDPDFTTVPPTGVEQVIGSDGPGDQDFNAGVALTQSDSIYVIQDANGCLSEPTFVELIINELPIVAIPPASICSSGDVTTLMPIVTPVSGNYTYDWVTPPGYTGPTNQLEITTSVLGSYTLLVIDENGCQASDFTTVFMATPPQVTIQIVPGTSTCFGDQVSVESIVTDGSGNYGYQWTATGGSSVFGEEDVIVTLNSNMTTVTVIVTDFDTGCQVTSNALDIFLNPLPQFPSTLPEILICAPDYISSDLTELDADILANVTNGIVTWYEGDPEATGFPIADPTNVNVPLVVQLSGGIYAQITDNDTGCQNSMQIMPRYDNVPMPDAGPDIVACSTTSTISIVGSALNPGQTATWSWSGMGNNLTDNGDGTASFIPTGLSGMSTLTYEVTSQFGCIASDTRTVTVNPETPLGITTSNVSDCGLSEMAVL